MRGFVFALMLAVVTGAGCGTPGGGQGSPPAAGTSPVAPTATAVPAASTSPVATPASAATPSPAQATSPLGAASPSPVPLTPGPDDRVNKKDSSVLVQVPEGPFKMGGDGELAEAVEKPVHEVTLPAFWIGKYEVTNQQFERFVAATGYDAGSIWKERSRKWGATAPVVGVSWNDAQAYCKWAGLRLPSEAEWEKAARGTDRRQFPWGNTWDTRKAWYLDSSGLVARPVGTLPAGASPFGCLDMAGNGYEWVADWYEAYPGARLTSPDFGKRYRIVRGGCWYSNGPKDVRTAARLRSVASERLDGLGFRVAASSAPVP